MISVFFPWTTNALGRRPRLQGACSLVAFPPHDPLLPLGWAEVGAVKGGGCPPTLGCPISRSLSPSPPADPSPEPEREVGRGDAAEVWVSASPAGMDGWRQDPGAPRALLQGGKGDEARRRRPRENGGAGAACTSVGRVSGRGGVALPGVSSGAQPPGRWV